MIKVVCCSPHKIRDKLICKGGKTIKSIEIIVPEKPKPPPEKPKPPPEKPKEPEKPKPPPEKPKEPEKPKPPPEKPKPPPEIKAPPEKPKPADPPKHVEKLPAPPPVAGYPQFYPVAVCCKPCFDLGHGGPCHHSYGIPHQRPSSYDGYVKLVPSYDESYGGWSSGCRCNRSYGCRCEYFTEENPACTIM
ncbi:early nodulin-75 isoform X3 [Vitis vinifera]|nr:early nodulin-75 isoform X3 [Vitis vinifera]|eukprot:XP_010646623.1 PREDICTED: early nodulin-75 isoform X2 [Vitis vinifera]